MTEHPNHLRTQTLWDGVAAGDLTGAFEMIAPDIYMCHGPGAGPFAGPGRGPERLLEMALFFAETFGGTFHQAGRCVYADDDCSITLVHETGKAPLGDVFDNRAIWISRFGPDHLIDAIWTVDLDDRHVREFWDARNHLVAP